MQRAGRKLAFVLASSNHGTMIVNRLDYRMLDAQRGYGVGFQLLENGSFDPEEVTLAVNLLATRPEDVQFRFKRAPWLIEGKSVPDVLASSANLLKHHGWQAGQPWLEEVRVPAEMPWAEADLAIKHTRSEWVTAHTADPAH